MYVYIQITSTGYGYYTTTHILLKSMTYIFSYPELDRSKFILLWHVWLMGKEISWELNSLFGGREFVFRGNSIHSHQEIV